MQFRGVVNIDSNGEVVCFCTKDEALRGQCSCQNKYNCPEAIISVDVISGTRPSEREVQKVTKVGKDLTKQVTRIKEGLSQLERALKKTKFRL